MRMGKVQQMLLKELENKGYLNQVGKEYSQRLKASKVTDI